MTVWVITSIHLLFSSKLVWRTWRFVYNLSDCVSYPVKFLFRNVIMFPDHSNGLGELNVIMNDRSVKKCKL